MTSNRYVHQSRIKESAPSEAILESSKLHVLAPSLEGPEKLEFAECEKIIRQGWDTFLSVGRALATIRQKRLYRNQYETFEAYCRQRWEFSKTQANRLIEAAEVAAVLTPIGVKLSSESQVRPLVGLSPQKIPAAWKKAEEIAHGGAITAKVVRRATEEFKSDSISRKEIKQPKKSEVMPKFVEPAMKLIDKAVIAAQRDNTEAVLAALQLLREHLLHLDPYD